MNFFLLFLMGMLLGEGYGLAQTPYPSTIWSSDRFHETLLGIKKGRVMPGESDHLVTLSPHRIGIYRLDENRLTQELSFEGKGSEEWIKLFLFDVNQDGQEEIIVTSVGTLGVTSQVFTISDNRFKELTSVSLYLGVVSWEGKNLLVAQKKLGGDDFSGPLLPMEWDGKKLIAKGKMVLPGGLSGESFSLYSVASVKLTPSAEGTGFARPDLGGSLHRQPSADGEVSNGLLYLHPAGTFYYFEKEGKKYHRVWSSGEGYGGSVHYLNIPVRNPLNQVVKKRFLIPVPMEIREKKGWWSPSGITDGPTMEKIDLNVYLVKNSGYLKELTGAVPSIKNSQFVRLAWTGYGFQENWNSPRLDGAITDFQLVDWDGDGTQEILAILLLRDQGYIDTLKKQDSLLIVIKIPESTR